MACTTHKYFSSVIDTLKHSIKTFLSTCRSLLSCRLGFFQTLRWSQTKYSTKPNRLDSVTIRDLFWQINANMKKSISLLMLLHLSIANVKNSLYHFSSRPFS
jgi:hypothetical protein